MERHSLRYATVLKQGCPHGPSLRLLVIDFRAASERGAPQYFVVDSPVMEQIVGTLRADGAVLSSVGVYEVYAAIPVFRLDGLYSVWNMRNVVTYLSTGSSQPAIAACPPTSD